MPLSADEHRRLGIELFNETWDHMDANDPRMVRTAYASQYHWSHVARPVEEHRSEWLLSRVWSVKNNGAMALHHAREAFDIGEGRAWTAADGFETFDRPYSLEALARASAASGDVEAARGYRAQAEEAAATIAEDDDRDQFLSDLTGGEWFGLS